MNEFKRIPEHDVPAEMGGDLFADEEKDVAEKILNLVEGMSVISARLILEKCRSAVLQSRVTFQPEKPEGGYHAQFQ